MNRPPASRIAALAVVLLIGCAQPRLAATGYNVSSERSDYSPVLRLAVALPITPLGADTLTIVIDSAEIHAPGARAADTPPIMRNLYITALLATQISAGERSGRPAEPWRALAASDSVLLVDALRLGEPQQLRGVRLHILRPPALDPTRTCLIFRVTGAAVTKEVQLADGRVIAPKEVAGGVRVFACADWSLAGYVDRRRARTLARAYTAAC